MENYRVAVGHDVDDSLLIRLAQQPRGHGAIPVDRKYGLTGAAHDDQLYTVLEFDMIESEEDYWDILLLFGVSANLSSPVTIKARDTIFTERKFNGIAHQPVIDEDVSWENGFVSRVRLRITHLEEIGS